MGIHWMELARVLEGFCLCVAAANNLSAGATWNSAESARLLALLLVHRLERRRFPRHRVNTRRAPRHPRCLYVVRLNRGLEMLRGGGE